MGPIGPLELGIVLLIVLLIFGPKRLPGLGKQLGSGMREFKDGITGNKDEDEDERRPQITPAQAEPTQAEPTQATAEAGTTTPAEDAPTRS
jgi:sec-independent protein translocase protein TatA